MLVIGVPWEGLPEDVQHITQWVVQMPTAAAAVLTGPSAAELYRSDIAMQVLEVALMSDKELKDRLDAAKLRGSLAGPTPNGGDAHVTATQAIQASITPTMKRMEWNHET